MSTYNITQTNRFYEPQIISRIQGQIGVTPLQVNTPYIHATTGVFDNLSVANVSFTGATVSNLNATTLTVSGASTLNSLTVSSTGTLGSLLVNGNTTLQNVNAQNTSSQNAAIGKLSVGYGSPTYNALEVLCNTVMTGALTVAGYNILNPSDPIGLYVTSGKGLQVAGDIIGKSGLKVAGNASVTGTLNVVGATTLSSATISSATISSLSATSLNVSTTGTLSSLVVSGASTLNSTSSTSLNVSTTGTIEHLVVNGNTTVQNIDGQNLSVENAAIGGLIIGYGSPSYDALQVICNTVMTGALTVHGYDILDPTNPIGLFVEDGKGLEVSGDINGLSGLNITGDSTLSTVSVTKLIGSGSSPIVSFTGSTGAYDLSVIGNDTAGKVIFSLDENFTDGVLFNLDFAEAYTEIPVVIFSPARPDSSYINFTSLVFVITSKTGFQLIVDSSVPLSVPPGGLLDVVWNYHVIGK